MKATDTFLDRVTELHLAANDLHPDTVDKMSSDDAAIFWRAVDAGIVAYRNGATWEALRDVARVWMSDAVAADLVSQIRVALDCDGELRPEDLAA